MDWDLLQKEDDGRIDSYFQCLYLTHCYKPPETEADLEIQKISRKLTTTALPKMQHKLRKMPGEVKKEDKKERTSPLPTLQLKNTGKSSGSLINTARPASDRAKVCESCSKPFMALRKELRQNSVLVSSMREENNELKREKEMLATELKTEGRRADQLKKLLEANGVPIPENLQFSKAPKQKAASKLKRSASANAHISQISQQDNRPPDDFWSPTDQTTTNFSATESAETMEKISSSMTPQMDIIRPGRLILQEASCVIVDCAISEKPKIPDGAEINLSRIYLFSDAILLAQSLKKKKIRPEVWFSLDETRVETVPENVRRRFMFSLISDTQNCRVGVFFPDRNSAKNWSSCIRGHLKSKRKNVLFGVPIECVPTSKTSEGDDLPSLVVTLSEYLRKTSLEVEGLFRLAGARATSEEIREILDQNKEFDPSQFDAHCLGDVLKQWFRELPVPAIPFQFYDRFVEEYGKGEETFVQIMPELFNSIPKKNLTLLRYISQFLHEVSLYSTTNMMTITNLATCFAPNLLRPHGEFRSPYEPILVNNLIRTVIENWGEIPNLKTMSLPPALIMSGDEVSPNLLSRSPSPLPFLPPPIS